VKLLASDEFPVPPDFEARVFEEIGRSRCLRTAVTCVADKNIGHVFSPTRYGLKMTASEKNGNANAAVIGLTIVLIIIINNSSTQRLLAMGHLDSIATLIRVYPNFLDRIDGNDLVFKDRTRMPIDDHKPAKPFDLMLDEPDIKDMFSMTYPKDEKGLPPAINSDPGRIRYEPLFQHMYGDCASEAKALKSAVDVVWLPARYGKKLKFTAINGAAAALQKVSNELDQLPASFSEYLTPPAGTYNCRPIAGTHRMSPHAFGIAIDISTTKSDYWLWSNSIASDRILYKNRIPWQIINIFEHHGFIWGGKWYHYDTMHFEYRPEIIAMAE
jgi:hypothetical protein